MKKKLVFMLALSLSILFSVPSFASARTIKIANAFAVSHPLNIAMMKFADIVGERSQGAIKIEVLHSSMLGGEMELIQQLLGELIEGVLLGGFNMFSNYDLRASVEDVPFLFKDTATGRKAMAGPYGEKIAREVIEPLGVKVLCFLEHGFRQITNNTRPIVTPDDLKGIKLRTPPLPLRVETFKLLGASPVPLAFPELFTALQQGSVDGQENPLATIQTGKFYEVQKYLSISNHTYTSGPLMLGKTFWESLSESERSVLLESAAEAAEYILGVNEQQERELLAVMQNAGIQVNMIDYEAFARKVQPVWENFKKQHGEELLNLALSAAE